MGERDKGDRIRGAVAEVVKEGKVRCYDMMRLPGGPKVFEKGACTTQQMTEAILAKL